MSIQDKITNIKRLLVNDEIFIVLLIVLVGLIAFSLGRQSVTPVVIDSNQTENTQQAVLSQATTSNSADITPTIQQYVASKSGSKYHLPWCTGAQQMKEENKVWFDTKEAAEAAGYTAAANCKGI